MHKNIEMTVLNIRTHSCVYLQTIVVAFTVFILANVANAAGIDDLRKNFEHPPDNARIMMRWWWFGPAVTKPEIEHELRVMKDGGIGGVEVQPVYPLLPDDPVTGIKNLPYLSDEFLEALRFTAQKCKELGMRFDLTLGSGWSFGGARTPITDAAGQLRFEKVKVATNTHRVPLPAMIPAEKLLAIFLARTDGKTVTESNLKELTDIRDGNVVLPADVPEGSEVLFFVASRSGMQVKRPAVGAEGYVLNHLDKSSVENYLNTTGDRLFQAFDKTTVPYSIFCDSLEVYNQDWTDDFLAEFQKRRGYDLKPFLPALVMDIGPKTPEIRYDWGRTITELFNERFMVPMQAWARRHGTKFRIQGYGIPPAAISSNQWADISDGEGAQWKVVRAARWASSANHIYGRTVTSSETWTWLRSPVFRATPLDLKAEADIHFLQGINQLIGHGWAYTPPQVEYPGWRFYAAGIYDEKNPWWIVMPDLAAYLQRISWLMRQGTPQNDVALYLPNADAYARFSAGRVHLIDAERDLVGEKVMPAIFEAGYNLDFFDDEMLRTAGRVESGNLAMGPSRHRVVVLPGIERMPIASLEKLEAFVRSGGILIATRRLPTIDPGFEATNEEKNEFKSIVARLFNGANSTARFVENEDELGPVLKSLLLPDVAISPSAKDFGFVHRKTQDADIYFIANTSNQKVSTEITFRTSRTHSEVWDAMNGEFFSPEVRKRASDSYTIALDFEPYQSHVIVFGSQNANLSARGKSIHRSSNGDAKTEPLQPGGSLSAPDQTLGLSSGWQITFSNQNPVIYDHLHSWTDDEATRFFSGVATYDKTFDLAQYSLDGVKTAILDFGEGTALGIQPLRNGMQTWLDPPIREAAVIYVNGIKAGSLWCPPYRLDIRPMLRSGRNDIRILVGNTALNYMAGRSLPDYKLLNLRYGERFQPQDMDKVRPVVSGIVGAPKLVLFK